MDDNTFDLSEQLGEAEKGPEFTAMYTDECYECDNDINEGDSVRYDDFGNLVHAECDS